LAFSEPRPEFTGGLVVTIPVECPHCESQFFLSPDLLGKSMRCPNPDCRDVFIVQVAGGAPPIAPVAVETVEAPAPQIFERVESNGFTLDPVPTAEAIPVLEPLPDDIPTFQPLPDEPPPTARTIPTAAPLPPLPTAPRKDGPKEIAWAGAAPPVAPSVVPPKEASADEEAPFIRRNRRRRRAWPRVLLVGVSLAIVATLTASAIGLYRHYFFVEQNLAEEAASAYQDGNFPVAQKKYEQLLTDFPGSRDTERYQFFARLSETRAAVASVTARENPAPAQKSFDSFLAEYGTSSLAQAESGFGADIVQAGKRLADVLADHAGDRLKTFRADRKKMDELSAAEKTVSEGKQLVPVVDKFRDKEGVSLEPQRQRFEELTKSLAGERHRLAVLAPFRKITKDPTAEDIEAFQLALKDNSLTGDAEAQQMLKDAERRLLELTVPTAQGLRAVPFPADRAATVLFAAPVAGSPSPRVTPGVPQDEVFAISRGVLYTLDAYTGALLWGTRVAPPTADSKSVDLPVRVSVGGGVADLALVAGEWGGRPGLTARVARTGAVVWYQPLEATLAARPVRVGGRIYVPLRDRFGTVAEFEIATGTRTREFTIRQPIGAGLAMLPGPGNGVYHLLIPGDTRRIFVFEVGREDANGDRLPPRCVRVLLTEHPRDSLRGEPLLITSLDAGGPRFLVLTQTDGPTTMKLRAFPLPASEAMAGPGGAAVEEPTPKPTEVSVPGWSWFPPRTNGERVVLATDAGAFLAFGVNQIGNTDRPLFALPAPKPTGEVGEVARSQVVAVEEDAYWVILAGRLVRLRTAVDPMRGLHILPQGSGRVVGEPVNRAQVLPTLGLGVVVVQAGGSPAAQAVGFDLQTGQVRWERRLGAAPAGAPVAAAGGPCVVADEDGGVYAVTAATSVSRGAIGRAAAVVAPPFAGLAGHAILTGSADGRTAWILAPEADKTGRRLRIRCVRNGQLVVDSLVPLPDQLAGAPVALGDAVFLPAANGYVYRYARGDSQLQVGPLWRGESDGAAVCHLSAVNDEEFLASDGGRKFLRWRWSSATSKPEKLGGPWETRAKIAVAPVAVRTGGGLHVAAADVAGVVYLFDAEKPDAPLRRWHGGVPGPIPAGTPTERIVVVSAGGRPLLVYGVDHRHLVALDPEQAKPAWVAAQLVPVEAGQLAGWSANDLRVIATAQSGRVFVRNTATGAALGTVRSPGAVAAAPVAVIGPDHGLLMLADGAATTIALPRAASAATPN
jgi:outer membrane protein assembly factor BamB